MNATWFFLINFFIQCLFSIFLRIQINVLWILLFHSILNNCVFCLLNFIFWDLFYFLCILFEIVYKAVVWLVKYFTIKVLIGSLKIEIIILFQQNINYDILNSAYQNLGDVIFNQSRSPTNQSVNLLIISKWFHLFCYTG